MTSYDVTVLREDPWWVADITGPGLGPAATDVEHFADLEVDVRDLIAGLTDSDPDGFDLRWKFVINDVDVTEEFVRLAAAENALGDITRARESARRAVLDELSQAGVSQATIGDVLGLSHQRVHQLLKAN